MRPIIRFTTIAIANLTLVACGQNSAIHISPASADAKNFPGGVVAFAATGVTNPTWCIGMPSGICNGNIASPAVIDSSGHAQCVQGGTGTVTVLAGTGVRVGLPDTGKQLSNFGTAQLICP